MKPVIRSKQSKYPFASFLFLLLSGFTFLPGNEPNSGIDTAGMERTVSPADDFYAFANGSWVKNNPIPASEASWGSFRELQESNNLLVRTIMESAAATPAPDGTIRQKVGDFYSTAMDTARLEAQGLQPLDPYLKRIASIKSFTDVMSLSAFFHQHGMGSLFTLYVTQDLKKSDEHIAYIGQGGLGLPDRDYYLKDDEDSKRIRKAYIEHIGKIFTLAGKETMASDAPSVIMKIETEFAKASMTNVELRDDEKQYNRFTYTNLVKKYPAIPWDNYYSGTGMSRTFDIIVAQPDFFKKINEMAPGTEINDWKIYMTWCLLNETADKLNSAMEKQNFAFYGIVLSGAKEMRPRWKRIVNATNAALGEAVGQLYVEKAFSAESKRRVNEMVDNLMAVYKERIMNLDWMSQATKEKALIKLASFNRKLGYPDKWKDYTPLKITHESYLKNSLEAQRFRFNYMLNKLGKPVDKTEWGISPQTVNAYYHPSRNEIVFPAAIMQPPFFNPLADDAVNYGAIGAVIGHEITHGFDDQGSKFDEKGSLTDWWTKEDREKFNERARKLIAQFNGYKALDDLNVNGELTLGENIADLGGLNMAYLAYQRSLKGKTKKSLDGFSPEQRFFVGWAQVWRVNYRNESLRQQVLTNVHAPDHFRAIGAPSNLPEFYEAFEVKAGNKMYRDDSIRVRIW